MKLFKKLVFGLSCLSLSGCIFATKISNINVKYVEKDPINYKTVAKTIIEVDTYDKFDPNPDKIKTHQFSDSHVVISYYDKDNQLITKEYTKTLQEAFDQLKTGKTLVENNGKGTKVTYMLDDKNKSVKETSVPYVAEVNKSEIKTDHDLFTQLDKFKPKNPTYDWEGETNNKVEKITVTFKENYDELVSMVVPDGNGGTMVVPQWQTQTRYTDYVYSYSKNEFVRVK